MKSAVDLAISRSVIKILSENLKREVTITLLLPDTSGSNQPLNLLLLNDGQEADNLNLCETLEYLYDHNYITPVFIAAIHAGDDRLQEYGTAGIPDFKQRGSEAQAYTDFILQELLPAIYKETSNENFATVAFAGFSLGGLSALDICWNHAEVFHKVGIFSGSLWWRSKDLTDGYTDNDRIMHQQIRNTNNKPALKFFFQTGTNDETADRNQNGIIDAIDDTIDLIMELENKGYNRPDDIHYLEMVGGRHEVATWAKAMSKFLCWAFKR